MNARELAWRKSSYSTNNGDCVEVAWRKSSYSATNNGCVEVAWRAPATLVRDSKYPAGGALTFDDEHWRALLSALR